METEWSRVGTPPDDDGTKSNLEEEEEEENAAAWPALNWHTGCTTVAMTSRTASRGEGCACLFTLCLLLLPVGSAVHTASLTACCAHARLHKDNHYSDFKIINR